LDPVVCAWNGRSLAAGRYPFVVVDALVMKVRDEGRVRSQSLFVAQGVHEAGPREVLALMLGDSESESSWSEFFAGLKARGLQGVDLVVSDDHSGLVQAVRTQFQGVTWQRCQTHFTRNVLDKTPKTLRSEVKQAVRAILTAPEVETARLLLQQTLAKYEKKASRAMECLENGFDDATAVLVLPERYRRRLRTTNALERLNEEIRRRERVIRIFPNRASVMRLVGALLMEIDEKWTSGKKYLDMTEYWEWLEASHKNRASSRVTRIG